MGRGRNGDYRKSSHIYFKLAIKGFCGGGKDDNTNMEDITNPRLEALAKNNKKKRREEKKKEEKKNVRSNFKICSVNSLLFDHSAS